MTDLPADAAPRSAPPAIPPATLREIWSWAMFDFANSSYTTVIVSLAYGVYFTRLVAPPGKGDLLWGLALGVGNFLVLLLSPVIGAIADDSGRKKLFLAGTYATCVVGTALLWFVTPGRVALGFTLLVVSFIGFSFGENLCGSFLPEISTPKNIGRISGLGWGLGYFGGLAAILLVRPLLSGGYTLENSGNLRLAWLATGLFFLVAALPTFLFLRERAPRGDGTALEYIRAGFARIADTGRSVRHFRQLVRFLSVFFVYSMGLTAVIAFAGIFAERTLAFTPDQLILLFVFLQLSSAGGAFAFGFLQDRLGAAFTIQVTLVLWILVCLGVYACGDGTRIVFGSVDGKELFWWVAIGAGLGIGSLQSASRGLVGLFSPPAKSGEFFGFWGLAGKGAYMLGPAIFGLISSATGSQRLAILATGAFFLLGLFGMAFVSEKKGHAEAAAWQEQHPA